jgi:hypothetical protein
MTMKVQFVSILGRSFEKPEGAIEDEKRLPHIIAIYENDLERMKNGLKEFGCKPVTEELIAMWERAIAEYKAKWEEAQTSWTTFDLSN